MTVVGSIIRHFHSMVIISLYAVVVNDVVRCYIGLISASIKSPTVVVVIAIPA